MVIYCNRKDADTALRPALGEKDSGVRVGEKVRFEPRSTIPEACFRFIADSLFRSKLSGCAGKGTALVASSESAR
jgi:hypothetical protein